MRKGLSPLVSYVIVLGIVIAGVGIILSMGFPLISQMRDTASIQTTITTLQELDAAIMDVAAGAKFTATTFQFSLDRGELHFLPSQEAIEYRLRSSSEIISAHSSRAIGPVTLSASTGVSARRTSVNGTDCFMLENDHVAACIRAIDTVGPINTSELLVSYRNKDLGRTLTPRIGVAFNDNASATTGTGYTRVADVDDDLGRATVTAHINSSVHTYNLSLRLVNGADFLSLQVD